MLNSTIVFGHQCHSSISTDVGKSIVVGEFVYQKPHSYQINSFRLNSCLYRTTHRAPGQNVTAPAEFPHEEDLETPLETTPAVVQNVEGMTEKDFLDVG